MSLKKSKDFFKELEHVDFAQFMNEYLAVYTELKSLIEKSHAKSQGSENHIRFNVNLHYRIRQGTLTLEKLGAAFRARTIDMEKRRREGFNYG